MIKSRFGSILLFLMLFMGVAVAQQSQQNTEQPPVKTVSIPEAMLTPQQKSALEVQNLKGWAGVGHEIGTAVNESLKAITTNAADFAKTDVGKLTVVLVVWKVIGDQAVHVVFGLLFALTWIPIWVWSYRSRCVTRSVLSTIATDKTKTYTVVNRDSGESAVFHALFGVALLLFNAITIFSY